MLPIVEILRIEENYQYGTFGILRIQKEAFCVTLEPPDLENLINRSSIPAQQYLCTKFESPKFGSTYIVTNVPARNLILFHPGNVRGNTEGCILLAQHYGKIRRDRAVLNSGDTFAKFMTAMKEHERFHLTIREVY
jgi:hypothetical protein